jgi:outer membrane protein assembly factor BamB
MTHFCRAAALALVGLAFGATGRGADVLPWAPREAQRAMTVARDAAADGRYAEAAELVESLLAGPEDGFVSAAAPDVPQRTLKVEAAAMLASFPPEGLAAYETTCGGKARRLLEQAVRQGDRQALGCLAKEYPCTAAGAEAALLLGYDGLSRGRPGEAIAWLRWLGRGPAVARRLEPERTLAAAVACLMDARPEAARDELASLGSLGTAVRFRIGDEEFAGGDDPGRMIDLLAAAVGADAVAPPAGEPDWPVFRGDAARNAPADWCSSIGPLRWKVDSLSEGLSSQTASLVANYSRSRRGVALPTGQPLAVGPLVLARTPERLVAIDRDGGRQLWEFPRGGDALADGPPDARSRSVAASTTARLLAGRAYDDAPYGQLASDGRLVFLIDGLPPAWANATPVIIAVGGGAVIRSEQPKPHNRLVALAMVKEGKLAWSVGAESGEDEPALAGAFFLGPPLVDDGRLYVLAEMAGQIRLCALEASSGRLEWSLLLAVAEQPVLADHQRRLAGATPSLADGVLVCPTSAGAVVAVDPVTRSILWGYQYPTEPTSTRVLRLRIAGFVTRNMGSWQATSVDATATIADGCVLLAPVESGELLCLDLLSGQLVWKRPADDLLYVAGVTGGIVLAVGQGSLSAWHLNSGKPAWDELAVELPEGAVTSGRGLLVGNRYCLPTTVPAILKIDVDSGRTVGRLPMESTPGNLVGLGPLLVSQSPEAIVAFDPAPKTDEE